MLLKALNLPKQTTELFISVNVYADEFNLVVISILYCGT